MAQTAAKRRPSKRRQESPAWSHGRFHWNELNTHDAAGAKTFYKDSIGWSFEAMSMGEMTYWIANMGGQPVGGIFQMSGPDFKGVPEHWLSYLAVDDVDKRVKKALKAGAKLARPVFDVPGVGRIAIVRQPGGAMVGWMTPSS